MDDVQRNIVKDIVKFAIGAYEKDVQDNARKVREMMDTDKVEDALKFLRMLDKKMVGGWRMVQDIIQPALYMVQPEKNSPVDEVLDNNYDTDDIVIDVPRRYNRIPSLGGIMQADNSSAKLNTYADKFLSLLPDPKSLEHLLDSMHTTEELLKMQPDNELYQKTKAQLSKDIQAKLDNLAPVLAEVRPLEEMEDHS